MKKFLWITLAVIICIIGLFVWKNINDQKSQEKAVVKLTEPVIEKLDKQIEQSKAKEAGGKPEGYDIEQAMRVVNGLELALGNTDYRGFVSALAREDLHGVPADVLESRKGMFKILNKLHSRQGELEDQENAWLLTQNISQIALNSVSTIAGSATFGAGEVTEIGARGVQEGLSEIQERDEIRRKLKSDIGEIQDELSEFLVGYSETYYKYLHEWDKILVHRDKAYLAINSGNFPAARQAIADVLKLNPKDKEAQLLDALVDIETNGMIGQGDPINPLPKLDKYIEENPAESAPALLLKGSHFARNGDFDSARLNFEQASVNYPRQSETLTDRLNPYRVRSVWLKKSREGNYILNLYKASMLGAGYFSPDLQLARMYFERDEFEKGKEKILDHFSRRRNQAQWDNILADIDFCNNLLEKDFNRIFPEDSFLDLNAEMTMFRDNVLVSINNQSDVKLTNVSLILCLHFTDMHRYDYATFKMEETLPALEPNDRNSFGKLPIDYQLFGQEKTNDDIVHSRAVLISNEAVTWVDSNEFRLKQIKEEIQAEKSEPREVVARSVEEKEGYLASLGLNGEKIRKTILETAKITIDENLVGSDKVEFKLPRSVAMLKPVFRLAVGEGEEAGPLQNSIKGENVDLVFKKGEVAEGDRLDLKLYSRYVNAVVTFEATADGFRIADVDLKE